MAFVIIGIAAIVAGIVFVYYGLTNLNYSTSYLNPITRSILSVSQYDHFEGIYQTGLKEIAIGAIIILFGIICPIIGVITDKRGSSSELEE